MLKAVGEAKDKVIAAKDERIAELLRRVGGAQKAPQADGWSRTRNCLIDTVWCPKVSYWYYIVSKSIFLTNGAPLNGAP